MSGTLASLRIALGLDASGVAKGAAVAKREINGLGRGLNGATKAGQHFKSTMGSIAKTAGLIGGIALAYKGEQFITDSIAAAQEWGRTVDNLQSITGLGTAALSRFSDAFDKLGINADSQIRIIAFMQKTLGNLALKEGAAAKFQKEFGFAVLDSNGHVKDALTTISDFTGYFNDSSIPAWKKAALGAKLFGRSWTTLLPIFQKGQKGMDAAMKGAMTMTAQQQKDLHRLRDSQRDYNDAIGDLKVQVGLVFVPAIADMVSSVAKFVDSHQTDIVRWFREGLQFAKEFAGYLANTVAPVVIDLAKQAVKFWNAIPPPLRDLLIKGIVAERAIKFLFGISITGLVQDALGGALKGLFGSFFQRGGTPANPLFVADVTGGKGIPALIPAGFAATLAGLLGKGATTGIAGALGGGMAAMAVTGGLILAAVVAVGLAVKTGIDYQHGVETETAQVNDKMGTFLSTSPTQAQMDAQIAALQAMPAKLGGIEKTLFDLNASGVKDTWQQQMDVLTSVKAVLVQQPARTGAEFAKVIGYLESNGIPVTSDSIVTALSQRDAAVKTVQDILAKAKAAAAAQAAKARGNADKNTHQTRAQIRAAAAEAARHARKHDYWTGQVKWATAHGFEKISPPISATATNTANTATAIPGISAGLLHAYNVILGLFGQPHAAGGWAPPGSRILVGEKRPEVLTMGRQGARIDPHPSMSAAGLALRSSSARETGDTYHFHIGTLIGNDAGLDELERRMEARKRHRTRGGLRLAGAS